MSKSPKATLTFTQDRGSVHMNVEYDPPIERDASPETLPPTHLMAVQALHYLREMAGPDGIVREAVTGQVAGADVTITSEPPATPRKRARKVTKGGSKA